jgi:hypothetical protein
MAEENLAIFAVGWWVVFWFLMAFFHIRREIDQAAQQRINQLIERYDEDRNQEIVNEYMSVPFKPVKRVNVTCRHVGQLKPTKE